MEIDIYSSHKNININDIRHKAAVVIDVLRSTSTLIFAFNNGLNRFLVVDDPIKAPDYTETLNNDRILMGGVDDFRFIAGFDCGETMDDYTSERINGKELIYYQSDTSPTIQKGYHAKHLFLGGFINIHAVAEQLVSLNEDTVFLCAGTDGNFSLEDSLAAGAIINEMKALGASLKLSEYAVMLDEFYNQHADNILDVVKCSKTYNKLIGLSATQDIEHALTKDLYSIVPYLYDNWITAKQ